MRAIVLVALVAIAACDDDGTGSEDASVCIPGASHTCFCGGGTRGHQVCKDDGSGYGACLDCADPSSSSSSSGGPAPQDWALWPLPPVHPSAYVSDAQTVTDTVTALVWQRVPAGTFDWNGAVDYCGTLTLGGVQGWRLPTLIELESIADYGAYNPAINGDAFPGTPADDFWTGSRCADYAEYAWTVHFGHGYANYGNVYDSNRVRCVR